MNAGLAPVVVVGAGPVGVSAATLLAQRGVEVLVLDRWLGVYPQPRAVHLDDEVFRILARLGVADEFAAISRPSEGLRLQDAQHRVFAQFQRAAGAGRNGYPQANMFDQPELEEILRANLLKQPTVTYRGDVEVTAVDRGNDGSVRVEFTDRASGESESVLASYVLGCDGANSVVRRSIGSSMRDLKFQQRWLVVDVNIDRELGQWEGVHQVCDTDRAATYMRITDVRYRWEFQLKEGESASDFEPVETLLPLLRPWTGDIAGEELEVVRVAEYTFRAQLADRWRDGPVFLLGDAAHLTPPFIGQGMGAGLRDAANLTWKLAGVLGGKLPESVLDTYEVERRPHARQTIWMAMAVGNAMTRGGRVGDLLRRWVAPRLGLVPGLRDRILDSASPRLSASDLVLRRRRDRLAGTLCPNLPVAGGVRFDELTHGRPMFVATRAGGVEHSDAVLVEPGDPLGVWLASARAHVAAVRPDGTVMASGTSAARVAAACASLLS